MISVVLASDNPHKLEEYRCLFARFLPEVLLLPMREAGFSADIEENADTFEGNAFLKASAVCAGTGLPALADDSGLMTDALGGRPGVYSARYSGVHGDDDANIEKLLRELETVPDPLRTARFVCAVCAVRPDGDALTVRGVCEGTILRAKRGTGTFGYDPIFLYPPFGQTFAEMDGESKNAVSHRGRAMEQLMKKKDFFLK